MNIQQLFGFFFYYSIIIGTVKSNRNNKRRHLSLTTINFNITVNASYNKLHQHVLDINDANIINIEPRNKVWFSIEHGIIYSLPLFGDFAGPFHVQLQTPSNLVHLKLKFHFSPSRSLFSPSNHLLLASFNMSSSTYNLSTMNRYFIVQTLSLALNLNETLLTIHKVNGSMIKVYFSCDLYLSTDLAYEIKTLINYYYSKREELFSRFSLPLIDITIVRLSTQVTKAATIEVKSPFITMRPRVLDNRTVTPSKSTLIALDQFYQPLVIVPLAIILIGLLICTIIACCLCCNRSSSSSSSTLLLSSGSYANPNNKNFYQNYSYRKYRQQQETYRKHHGLKDQREFISKGIPVVFTEELEEKLEQTHTPLVMRIEKAPFYNEEEKNALEKGVL